MECLVGEPTQRLWTTDTYVVLWDVLHTEHEWQGWGLTGWLCKELGSKGEGGTIGCTYPCKQLLVLSSDHLHFVDVVWLIGFRQLRVGRAHRLFTCSKWKDTQHSWRDMIQMCTNCMQNVSASMYVRMCGDTVHAYTYTYSAYRRTHASHMLHTCVCIQHNTKPS